MISIHIVRDSKGFIWEFSISGHAGFGEHGEDIVCSAVSAVAYTAIGALDHLAGVRNYSEKDGYMKCSIPLDVPQDRKFKAQVILDAMAIGLKQIEDSYKKYVSVVDEEV